MTRPHALAELGADTLTRTTVAVMKPETDGRSAPFRVRHARVA